MNAADAVARPRGLGTHLRRVTRLLFAERGVYLVGSIFVIVGIGTALAYPYVIGLIIDHAIRGGQLQLLNRLSLAMVGILATEAVSKAGRDYWFGLGAERIGIQLQRMTFRTLLAQDIQFFDARDVGEITTRLWSDVPPLEAALGEELADTLRDGVFSVLGTGLLFYTSPLLASLMLLAFPPIAAATSVLGRRVKRYAADVQRARAEAGAAASEVLGGIRTVRAFSRERDEADRYDGRLARALESARKKVGARAALGVVWLIAGEGAALLAIWVGGRMIVSGRLTTGALLSFILYALLVAKGYRQSSRFAGEMLRAIGATSWVFDLLEQVPRTPIHGGARPATFDGSIVFEQVHFSYPARPHVEALKGIDLRIAPGTVVALVGQSGAGKSTILNLILRFYDPNEGRVLVGGYDVRELDPSWLRQHIATVMQEPTLFSRSVGENIGYGVSAADPDDIATAADLAAASEFIDRLPGGYSALVGDRGVQLSGGQRQRLAIARALLRRPKILILDEATSALDVNLESEVQRALAVITFRPTTIVIAHRLSTVAQVDRVIVLDGGRIVETGTHDDLMRTSPAYRRLVQTQLVAQ